MITGVTSPQHLSTGVAGVIEPWHEPSRRSSTGISSDAQSRLTNYYSPGAGPEAIDAMHAACQSGQDKGKRLMDKDAQNGNDHSHRGESNSCEPKYLPSRKQSNG